MLETVLQYGTAKAAALDEFAAGKTGTTSNYVDAWFVGWNHKYTVAVWVGYPEGAKAMSTDYDGGPVLGGTFPALIWHDFMISALGIEKERSEHAASSKRGTGATSSSQSSTSTPEAATPSSTGAAPGQTTAPTTGAGTGKEGTGKSATPGGGSGEAGTGAAGAGGGGGEHEHAASPAPATPTPEAPSAPSSPSSPAPSTPGAGGVPNSPSPTGGVSAGG